jgi:hypothetical protein
MSLMNLETKIIISTICLGHLYDFFINKKNCFFDFRRRQKTYNEKYVLLSMTSPFILSSWLSTNTKGLTWSGKWNKNVSDGQAVLHSLVEAGLLVEGMFIMYSKNPSFAKLTPAAIQEDRAKVASFESFGITLREYQAAYENMKMPDRAKLNSTGVKYLSESEYFIPYYHLYTQGECLAEIDTLVRNGKINRTTGNHYVLSDTAADNDVDNSKFSF